MGMSYTVGVDVGGTKVAYGLFDGEKKRIAKSVYPTAQGLPPAEFLSDVAKRVCTLCEEHGVDPQSLSGVGLGMPCFIRQTDGHIIKSSNIPTLRDFPARAFLENALGTRIELGNDTHAAGLAESRHGAGRGYQDMLYCSVSSGIASAPILGGKLFRGSYGFAGESGHMVVTPGEGVTCACGKQGCFMSWCSGHMIVKHVQRWIAEGGQTAMLAMANGDPMRITTHELSRAWQQSDKMAVRAVEQMQQFLSLWLFDLYLFTNINCFVLGGGLLKMGDAFWDEVFRRFHQLDDGGMPVYFKRAEMGDETGIIGANELLY